MDYKKKTLENGLRVITVPMPESLTTTVLVLAETGSKYETKSINGISHFLEHLCFKGTKNRPDPVQISTELDSLGAESNAFTGHEYTGYYAQAESRHFKNIFEVIADTYANPVFPKEEIEKEKGVIIGEIDMSNDHPMDLIGDLLTDVLYGDQPAGWRVLGTKENIRAMTRKDIAAYRKKHYVPKATVVVVAGDVTPAQVFRQANKYFAQLPGGTKATKKRVTEKQHQPHILVEPRKTNQTHLALGFRGFAIHDARVPALSVLAAVLGKGMSSRLFKKLRDEMGVGYYVFATNDLYTDHGYFGIFAGVENARLEESLEAIVRQLQQIKEKDVPEDELTKAKNLIIGGLFRKLETSDDMAAYYGKAEILRTELDSPERRAEKIRAVTAEDVQEIAQELFTSEKANLALIGPKPREKRLRGLLAHI